MSETLTMMIDDTDPSIHYIGDWVADKGSLDNFSNYGPPLMGTSHYINGTGGFSWTFSGTYVGVFGSSVDGKDPSRVCTVDGATIPNNPISQAVNSIMQCQIDGLKDGQHTIVGPGWSKANTPFGTIATVNGASMSVPVTGPGSVIWMGYYLQQFPSAATTATYTIDGGNPLEFDLNGMQAQSTGAELNQRFFTMAGPLSPGQHILNVTYNGNNDTTPLSLYSFTVLNGTSSDVGIGGPIGASHPVAATDSTTTSSSTSPTSSGSSSQTGSPTQTGSSKGHTNIGAIVGDVVVAFLCFLLLSFIFWRKRRGSRNKDDDSAGMVQPFTALPSGFPPMSEIPASNNDHSGSKAVAQTSHSPPPAQFYTDDLKRPLSSTGGTAFDSHSQSLQPNMSYSSPPRSETAEPEVVILHDDSGVRLPTGGTPQPGYDAVNLNWMGDNQNVPITAPFNVLYPQIQMVAPYLNDARQIQAEAGTWT
ncbi:hypothetical protein BDN70DRAFT_924629 [Pholiota conissans]|uniref:Uncharacterized protein n=1 Tax=Pholiota conissans TaxID=109636 RepID=A0A9P6CP91_9AGAR|nr:hypothetical protein BDN70DRAFT_924629 [Pholiota conissans]